jgi:flagellin
MASVDITRIAGNIGALNALNSLQSINKELALHQLRLQTGKQINSAADDPAGMSIATSFNIRRQGLQTVLSSIGDAQNLLATSEGGLTKIQDILVQMQNKALQGIGDTLGTEERTAIANQLNAYKAEINDIVKQTQWNGNPLLGKMTTDTPPVQAAPDALNFLTSAEGGTSGFNLGQGFWAEGVGTVGLDLKATDYTSDDVKASDPGPGSVALGDIQDAITKVKTAIGQVGAFSARLSFKEEALTTQYTNTDAAYNRIMNADMAQEQVDASKLLILQQTSTAMLAQANSAPQFILSLFR